jgi:beta-lactamase superfamily II metal-dependent hydrolase
MLRPLLIVCLRRAALNLGWSWRRWTPLLATLLLDAGWSALTNSFGNPQPGGEVHSGRLLYALAVGGGLSVQGASPEGRNGVKKQPWKNLWIEHFHLALGSWIPVALWDCWNDEILAPLTPVLSLLTIPIFTMLVYPLLLAQLTFPLGDAVTPMLRVFSFGTERLLQWTLRLPSLWHVPRSALLISILFTLTLAAGRITLRRTGRLTGTKVKPSSPHSANLMNLSFVLIISTLSSTLLILTGFTRGLFHHPAREPLKPFVKAAAREIHQLDVGQGDAALVIANDGGAGLIDTGAEYSLNEQAWLELFLQRGVYRLDWVALTHLDQDHAAGLHRLAGIISIGCVVTSPEELETDRGRQLSNFLAQHGISVRSWKSPCIPFPAIGPRRKNRGANANMSAILVPLENGGFYLSAGDADSETEKLIAQWPEISRMRSQSPRILKLSHHGSKTSSSLEFLQTVRPTESWISAGVGNRYGHPSIQVLDRLKNFGIPLRRTDRDGSVQWLSGNLPNDQLFNTSPPFLKRVPRSLPGKNQ